MPPFGREFETLLLEARRGSTDALGQLLQAYRRHLVLTARRSLDPALGRKISPSDLVQETLFRAGREFAAFGGKTEGEFQAWLGAILKNLTTNLVEQYKYTQKRSLGREVWLDDGDSTGDLREKLALDTPTPGTRAAAVEERERLALALARLPEEYRQVIRLRDFESRSWEEIGREMSRPPNAARALWYRAVDKLREALEVSNARTEA